MVGHLSSSQGLLPYCSLVLGRSLIYRTLAGYDIRQAPYLRADRIDEVLIEDLQKLSVPLVSVLS